MKKVYLNYGYFLIVFLAFFIGFILIFFLFQPIFKSHSWVIWGTFLIATIVAIGMTKGFPVILIITRKEVKFVGALWIFKFRREWIEEVIVDTGGFIFKPKPEHCDKYRRVTELTSGDWKGYKVISFINPKGLAEFVKVMRPITGDRIDWDRMSEKRKKYWWKLLYGSGNEWGL